MNRPNWEAMRAASRFYAFLIQLYPRAHREAYGEQMLRTFEDSYRDAASATGRVSAGFWVAVVWDEARSILREHSIGPDGRGPSDWLLGGLFTVWFLVGLLLPPTWPGDWWPGLAALAGVLGVLLVAARGLAGPVRKLATVALTGVAVAIAFEVGRSVNDVPDFEAPAVLLACLLFAMKVMAGWHATGVGLRVAVFTPAELSFGLLLGAAGTFALTLGASTTTDNDGWVTLLLFVVIPPLGGAAGFAIGRLNSDVRQASFAAVSTMLLAVGIWLVARAALAELTMHTSLLGPPIAAPVYPVGWRHELGPILFFNAIFALAGGVLGQLVRQGAMKPRPLPDPPRQAGEGDVVGP